MWSEYFTFSYTHHFAMGYCKYFHEEITSISLSIWIRDTRQWWNGHCTSSEPMLLQSLGTSAGYLRILFSHQVNKHRLPCLLYGTETNHFSWGCCRPTKPRWLDSKQQINDEYSNSMQWLLLVLRALPHTL